MERQRALKAVTALWACAVLILGVYSVPEAREVTVEVEIGGGAAKILSGATKPSERR